MHRPCIGFTLVKGNIMPQCIYPIARWAGPKKLQLPEDETRYRESTNYLGSRSNDILESSAQFLVHLHHRKGRHQYTKSAEPCRNSSDCRRSEHSQTNQRLDGFRAGGRVCQRWKLPETSLCLLIEHFVQRVLKINNALSAKYLQICSDK